MAVIEEVIFKIKVDKTDPVNTHKLTNWEHANFKEIDVANLNVKVRIDDSSGITKIKTAKQLHSVINWLDMYKDGMVNPSITSLSVVKSVMKELTTVNVINYQMKLLTYLEKTVLEDSTLSHHVSILPLVNLNGKYYQNKLPDNYTHAFVDASAKSTDFKKDIINVETPGSFIDPATRTCDLIDSKCLIYPHEIEIDLSIFGLVGITFKATKSSTYPNMFKIEVLQEEVLQKKRVLITVEIDRNGKTKNQKPTLYFSGNNIKNENINANNDKTKVIRNDIL